VISIPSEVLQPYLQGLDATGGIHVAVSDDRVARPVVDPGEEPALSRIGRAGLDVKILQWFIEST